MGGSQWKTKKIKDQHTILELYSGTLSCDMGKETNYGGYMDQMFGN